MASLEEGAGCSADFGIELQTHTFEPKKGRRSVIG